MPVMMTANPTWALINLWAKNWKMSPQAYKMDIFDTPDVVDVVDVHHTEK